MINFWSDFLSNFIATLLGAVIGVPFALWVNRIQQENIEKKEEENQRILAESRKQQIVDALEVELTYNRTLFSKFVPQDVYGDDSFDMFLQTASKGRTEVWRAFSNGGELKWIDDHELLINLASAYHAIIQVGISGRPLVESSFISGSREGSLITKQLQQGFEEDVRQALAWIDDALRWMKHRQ